MGNQKHRSEAENVWRLRKRYAGHFGVPMELVETHEYPDDVTVYCPSRPELPEWSMGGRS